MLRCQGNKKEEEELDEVVELEVVFEVEVVVEVTSSLLLKRHCMRKMLISE